MAKYQEKRDFMRMPIDCNLHVSVIGDDREFDAKVINLSAKGILFATRQKLEVGDMLSLVLTANTDTPPMHATVKVTRAVYNDVEFEVACIIRTSFE